MLIERLLGCSHRYFTCCCHILHVARLKMAATVLCNTMLCRLRISEISYISPNCSGSHDQVPAGPLHTKSTHTQTQRRRTCCLLAAISACRCSCLVFMAAMASSFVIGGGAGMLFIESSNTAAAAPLSALIVYVSMYARLCRWEVHWARCSIWRRKFTERCVGWLQQENKQKISLINKSFK